MKCEPRSRQTELHTAAFVFTAQSVCLALCEHGDSAAISTAHQYAGPVCSRHIALSLSHRV
jgi:hypothetical protein